MKKLIVIMTFFIIGCATQPNEADSRATASSGESSVMTQNEVQPQPATIEGTGWLAVRIYGREATAGRPVRVVPDFHLRNCPQTARLDDLDRFAVMLHAVLLRAQLYDSIVLLGRVD